MSIFLLPVTPKTDYARRGLTGEFLGCEFNSRHLHSDAPPAVEVGNTNFHILLFIKQEEVNQETGDEEPAAYDLARLERIDAPNASRLVRLAHILQDTPLDYRIALSPDKKYLAAATSRVDYNQNEVIILDLDNLSIVKRITTSSAEIMAFSPDGEKLAVGLAKGGTSIAIYRTSDWSQIDLIYLPHSTLSSYVALWFSEDSSQLYTLISNNGSIGNLYSITPGENVEYWPSHYVNGFEGFEDIERIGQEQILIGGKYRGGIHQQPLCWFSMDGIWGENSGKDIDAECQELDGLIWVIAMNVSPDGAYIAAADEEGPVGIYDFQTHELVKKMFGLATVPNALEYGPAGDILAEGGDNGDLVIISLPESKIVYTDTVEEDYWDSDILTDIGFFQDGRLLIGIGAAGLVAWGVPVE